MGEIFIETRGAYGNNSSYPDVDSMFEIEIDAEWMCRDNIKFYRVAKHVTFNVETGKEESCRLCLMGFAGRAPYDATEDFFYENVCRDDLFVLIYGRSELEVEMVADAIISRCEERSMQ